MWNCQEINFICRIVTDKDGKFKFDLVLRSEVVLTDGKLYDSFYDASSALHKYLDRMYDYDKTPNFDGSKHLIVNDLLFK